MNIDKNGQCRQTVLLGIDWGEKRIGVAVSDGLGIIASPLTVVEHRSLKEDVARVGELAAARKAERIVVGLPLNMDGSVGPSARHARRFANALRRSLGVEVEFWDETLTTVEAEGLLAGDSHGVARNKDRADKAQGRVDAVAAAIMLQSYLDSLSMSDGRKSHRSDGPHPRPPGTPSPGLERGKGGKADEGNGGNSERMGSGQAKKREMREQ